jgi:hypothetical protein
MLEALLIILAICAVGHTEGNARQTVIRIPTTGIQNTEYNVAVKRLKAFASPASNKGEYEDSRIAGF